MKVAIRKFILWHQSDCLPYSGLHTILFTSNGGIVLMNWADVSIAILGSCILSSQK